MREHQHGRPAQAAPELTPPIIGCYPPCEAAAYAQCESICRPNDCPAACAELDLEGACEDACTTACIDEGHAAGPTPGPDYGHPADLNFNITRVYDGAGNLYLENTYGTNLSLPDFDSITHQDFGGTGPDVGTLARFDLVAEAAEAHHPPAQDFETVQICPFTCPSTTADPHEVFVPVGDLVAVFHDAHAPMPRNGYVVDLTLAATLLPTLITFSADAAGTVTGRISRRTSSTNYLATTDTTLPITLGG